MKIQKAGQEITTRIKLKIAIKVRPGKIKTKSGRIKRKVEKTNHIKIKKGKVHKKNSLKNMKNNLIKSTKKQVELKRMQTYVENLGKKSIELNNKSTKKAKRITENKMDYTLKIGKGLGLINFNYREKDILKLLGEPDNLEKKTGNKCYTNTYIYNKYGIRIIIDFDEFAEPKYETAVMTERLKFKNKLWNNLSKNEIIKIIKTEYKNRKLEYDYNYELHDYSDNNFEEYNFDKIGVTIYFKNDRFDGAYILKR